MNESIKITRADGTVFELSSVDQIPSVMPYIAGESTLHVVEATPVAAPVPQPAPEGPIQQFIEGLVVPEQNDPPAPPAKGRPKFVYLTDFESRVMALLRQNPDGLTTAQISEMMGMDHSNTSARVSTLRRERPFKNTNTPLVVSVSNGVMRATDFGFRARLKVSSRPKPANEGIGWG